MTQSNAKPKLTVPLTPNYRLTADAHQFIVEERYVTQPAVNPPKDYVYIPREEWRELAYYGIRTESLELAIDTVILREAVRKTAERETQSLMEFASALRKYSDEVRDAINSVVLPQNYGELAVAMRGI